jgi:O-antigen/teichoic acid export membrane protein
MTLRGALRRLSGESLVYGFGQAGGRAIQLLLVPVLTRALLRQEFGVAELVAGYSASALLVLVLGLDGALARFFYGEPGREARVTMASTVFSFRLAVGVLVSLAIAAASVPLAERLLGDTVYARYLRLGAAALPFTLVTLGCNDLLRVTFQPWKFVALNAAQTLLVAGFTLWAVLDRGLGVAGVLWGKLAGDALAALLGVILCRHSLRPRFDRDVLARMLRYGLPLVPVSFAYGLVGSLDRWALQRHGSLDDVGTYALAVRFFAVVTMGVSAFQLAFMPFAYARAQDPGTPRLLARVFVLYAAVASLGALACGLAAPLAIHVLAPGEYAGAARPALWLCFAAVAQGAYTVAGLGINLSLRNGWLGVSAVGAALVAAVANPWLVARFGAEGAAAATFAAHATSAVVTYVIAQRLHPLPHRGARLAALALAGLGLGVLVAHATGPDAAGWAARAAAVAAFAGVAGGIGWWEVRGADRRHPASS